MRRPSYTKETPHENPLRQIAVFGRSGSSLLGVPVRVNRRKVSPLLRQIFQSKNRRHGTNRDTGATVNAFHGTDIQLRLGLECGFIFPRVDAIDRADVDARGVLRSNTGFSDYVRHRYSASRDIYSLKIQNRLAFAWKVSVYTIKPATSQAGFSSQKVYHVPIQPHFNRLNRTLERPRLGVFRFATALMLHWLVRARTTGFAFVPGLK